MEKNVYAIEEIFAGRFFAVPDYQRGYAWEKANCLDLLDDLEELPPGFNHYTGTVVFHRNDKDLLDNEGTQTFGYDIVDGQQRITSIVILLHTIQRRFAMVPAYYSLAAGIEKKFLKSVRLSDQSDFYKLTLNQDCRDFFQTDILGTAGVTGAVVRSHERLAVAKETFNNYINTKNDELLDGFYSWLIEFYNKVVQRLKVGIYEVDQAAEVGVIFEVMNNRGKDLTELEKVKNYLLYLTTKLTVDTASELAKNINRTWSHIYERFMSAGLGTESENQFLRAHWLFYADYNRKEWDGSKSIKGLFNLKDFRNRHVELLRELRLYVGSLDEASIAFADLERPERDASFNAFRDPAERRLVIFYSSKLIRTRTIASFRSVLMACRLRFPNDALRYLHLVQLLERFAFRVYNMQGKRADTGQSSILKAAYELYNQDMEYDDLLRHLRWLLHLYCPDEIFKAFWEFDALDNNWYYWSPLKYFLYEYEEYLAGGDPLTVTWSYYSEQALENSIEHILPQTSEDVDGYWPSHFTDEEIKIYTHDLGNLCLTYNNSSYKNFGFDRKKGTPGQEKPCYANSALNQERVLTEYPEWTVNTIQQRRTKVAFWATERWYVDLSEFTQVDSIHEDELNESLDELISPEE